MTNNYKVTYSTNGIKQQPQIVAAEDKSDAIEKIWELMGFWIVIDDIEEVTDGD